ncbi:PAS domain S-box protein [Winogradskyella eckloniae]|uniref:PAS domain S-box protein n=1 Tax=Winogradskyella eckloniae TaxID=1089306 RepID=UPI00156669A3|nr:PAS domain S-box protein [Winogradskyella eckloniae]NRD20382.1 PAS domain S-box protein [Winogradskyella eckloniae]
MIIYFILLLGLLLATCSFSILYKLRSNFGLAPLFMFLGAVLFFSRYLGRRLDVTIFDDHLFGLVSVVLFGGFLFSVLLIYIKEGVKCTRALITGALLLTLVLAVMMPWVQNAELMDLRHHGWENLVLLYNIKMLSLNVIILVIELILLVIVYQYIVQAIRRVPYFFVLVLSLVTVLVFDSFVFYLLMPQPELLESSGFVSQFLHNIVVGILYATLLYCHLIVIDKKKINLDFLRTQRKEVLSIFKSSTETIDVNYEKEVLAQKPAFKIENALNYISDGFVTLDNDWRFTFANIKTGEFLRENPEDLIGKQIWSVFPDNEDLYFSKQYHKAKQTQEIQTIEGYYKRLDKWFENRIYPSAEGVTIYFKDITEKKKRDNSYQMLGSLIETSDQFIGLASLEGVPFYLNSMGRALVGLDEESLPESIADVFPDAYRSVIEDEHMPSLFKDGKWTGEVLFRHFKTGALIPMEMSGFLIRDNITGKPISMGIVATNIEERKIAAEKLINSESLFKTMSSEAPSGIFQTSIEGSCNYVNEKWTQYAGISYDEAMGYGWASAMHPEDSERVKKEWQEYLSSKNVELETEFRFLHKNNKVVWVSVKTVRTCDADDNINGYIGMAIDITERKLAEEQLINSELLFRGLTANAPVGIFKTDASGSCSFVNKQWMAYSGLSFEEAMGFGWSNALHPDNKEKVIKLWQDSVENETEYNVDLRFYNKKIGKTFWLTVKSERLYNAKGELQGFIGVCIDITQRKHAEKQLIENERYLENILNNIGDPVFVKDDQSRIVLATDAFCSIFNMSKENILGQTLVDYFPEDARSRLLQNDQSVLDTGLVNIQEETLTLDKINTRSLSTKKTRFIDGNGNKFIIGVIRDITERKKVEKEIAKMQSQVNAAIRIGKIGYWSWDIKNDEIYWSDLLYDIYDVDKGTQLNYETVLSRLHPEDKFIHDNLIQETIAIKGSESFEYRVIWRDNSIKYVKVDLEVVTNEFDQAIRLQGTVLDITERKKAEIDLIDSEKLFKRLISNAPVAIFQTDREGMCNYVNEEWLAYTGQTFENIMGYGWTNSIHPEDKEKAIKEWEQAVKDHKDITFEFRLIDPNGEIIWLSNKAIRTLDSNNDFNGYIGITLNITDRKIAEEKEQKNKEYLNNILNNIGDPIFVKDDQSRLVLVNNAFCAVFGLPKESILGRTMEEKLPPRQRESFFNIDKKVFETGLEHVNEETVNFNGKEPRTFSIKKTSYNDGGNMLLLGVLRDVTERKKAEEEIRKTHQRLTTHLNNSPLGIIEWDKDFKITNWSPQAKNIFGWSAEDVVGKNVKELNLIYEKDKEVFRVAYNELINGTVKNNRYINRNYTQDKNIIYCEWYNSVLLSPTKEIESFFTMVQDVTERIEIEKGIAESEEKFSKVFNSSLIGYSIVNTDQVRVDVNEAMAKMLESTREHLIGKTMEGANIEVLDDFYYNQKKRLYEKLLENRYLQNEIIDRTLLSGKKISLLCSVETIEIAGETHALFAVVDNTEKKITEQELENYRNNLEELVALRTEEVNSKNAQLERMNKLFVGREIRMRELKDIIKTLKNKND